MLPVVSSVLELWVQVVVLRWGIDVAVDARWWRRLCWLSMLWLLLRLSHAGQEVPKYGSLGAGSGRLAVYSVGLNVLCGPVCL